MLRIQTPCLKCTLSCSTPEAIRICTLQTVIDLLVQYPAALVVDCDPIARRAVRLWVQLLEPLSDDPDLHPRVKVVRRSHCRWRGMSNLDARTTAQRSGCRVARAGRTFFKSMSNKDLSPGRWTLTTTRSPLIWARCTCADGVGCRSEGAAAGTISVAMVLRARDTTPDPGWPQQWAADRMIRTLLRSALLGSAPQLPWPDANQKLARCPANSGILLKRRGSGRVRAGQGSSILSTQARGGGHLK